MSTARAHLPAFLVQVAATAVGLLLALGLDQWRDQRRQAAQAALHLASVQAELRGNLSELDQEIAGMAELDAQLGRVSAALRSGGAPPQGALRIHMATLRQSAWDMAVSSQTVLASGAGRLTELAEAYEDQRLLRAAQDRLVDQLQVLTDLAPWLSKARACGPGERADLAERTDRLRSRIELLMAFAPGIRVSIVKALGDAP